MIETRGYYNAWVVLLNEEQHYINSAEAGMGKFFEPMKKILKEGELTQCAKKALKTNELIITENPEEECKDCPLEEHYADRGAFTIKLSHNGKIYGLLSVSIPRSFVPDKDEQDLFKEVAADLSFALHSIQIEKERRLSEKQLQQKTHLLNERVKELNCLYELSKLSIDKDLSLDKLYQGAVELIPPALLFPEITCARLDIDGREFVTKNHKETPWQIKHDITINNIEYGTLTVGYLEKKPTAEEGPFLKEEIVLIKSISEILGTTVSKKQTERKLQESEKHFKSLFNLMVDPVVIVGENGKFLEITDRIEEITGLKKEDFIGKYFMKTKIATAKSKAILIKNLAKRIMGIKVAPYEVEILTKDGKILPFEINAIKIDYKGKPADLVALRDISERKRAEKELKESEKRFRLLFENAPDAMYVHTLTGEFFDGNKAAEKLIGYKKEELIGKHILKTGLITKKHLLYAGKLFAESIAGKRTGPGELELISKNGEKVWIEIKSIPLKIDDNRLMLGMARDITERKQAEEAMKRDLQEKAMLLSEVHHRVKNSLQVVSSLLHLQSRQITDKHILDLFQQSQNRINMMAEVYEKLYLSKNFASIDVKEYLEDVLNKTYQFSGMSNRISLKLDVQNVVLGLDDAIPVALIMNELFTNSIKHAFPGDKKGKIEINFNLLDEETYQLIYRDNGVGLPGDVDLETTTTLGLHLINNLAKQICGEATLEQNEWTTFKIVFKGYAYVKKKYSHR